MTEPLPITIQHCELLREKFIKLPSILNKLEAQFNFQTLAAGWYEKEQDIQIMDLYLETPQTFSALKRCENEGRYYEFADDVFCYHHEKLNQVSCFIAITESELKLLTTQNKLLAGYVDTKIRKVLNLIANQLKLFPI